MKISKNEKQLTVLPSRVIVVLAIIGIILNFIVPNVINRPNEARKTKIINDIKVLESA